MPHPSPAAYSTRFYAAALAALLLAASPLAVAQDAAPVALGVFKGHSDIGLTPAAGNSVYDAAKQTLTITGGGNNVWMKADAFQYAWVQLQGNFSLAADVTMLDNTTATSDAHRKAMIMIRQSLDAGSTYVDVARHGDGLTSLQFRDTKDADTHEIRVANPGHAPARLKIEKRGDIMTVFIADKDGAPLRFSGASMEMNFQGPVYIGLGVAAHNGNDASKNLESMVFSNIELKTDLPTTKPTLYTTIETQPTSAATPAGDRSVLYTLPAVAEAPLWLPDNSGVIYSSNGKLYRVPMALTVAVRGGTSGTPPMATGEPVAIPTGDLAAISRVHALSPDGQSIVFVNHPQGQPRPPANVYMVPITGGTPKLLTPNTGAGSSLSPDGKVLAFDKDTTPEIFTIPVDGSAPETQLTMSGRGIRNYGAQFSPDGTYLLFSSDRSGTMQMWSMKPDGTQPTQVTNDEDNNWFPHFAPNGSALLFVSYPKAVTADTEMAPVLIRRLTPGRPADTLARIMGGPSSAPRFSPNGTSAIYTEYQWVY